MIAAHAGVTRQVISGVRNHTLSHISGNRSRGLCILLDTTGYAALLCNIILLCSNIVGTISMVAIHHGISGGRD